MRVRSRLPISDYGGLTMSATFETLFGLQFCQYKCGTYIGFSDDELSSDGKSHKPLEATTGNVHECPKEGWSKQKQCFGCKEKIMFHNSHMRDGKKIRFDSPDVRHRCTQQSYDYESNSQDDFQTDEKRREQQQREKQWEQEQREQQQQYQQRKKQHQQREQREKQRQEKQQREQRFRKIYDEKVIEAYAVFGLNHNATLEQIKSTFRKFALKYHPDKNKSPTANAMMVRINDAYEVITRWWKNHD